MGFYSLIEGDYCYETIDADDLSDAVDIAMGTFPGLERDATEPVMIDVVNVDDDADRGRFRVNLDGTMVRIVGYHNG